MVHITLPVLIAVLAIGESIAAPIVQGEDFASRSNDFAREGVDLESREPVNLKAAAKIGGKVFGHLGTAATVASFIPQRQNKREVTDIELEVREPGLGGIVGKIFFRENEDLESRDVNDVILELRDPGLGNVFRKIGKIFFREDSEFEAREPANFKAVAKLGGKILGHAGTAATVATMIPWGRKSQAKRDEEIDDLDARASLASGRGWALAGKSIGALAAGVGIGSGIAPLFKPKQKREMDELEERRFNPIAVGLKLGKALPYIPAAVGAAGAGLGFGAAFKNRRDIDLDEFDVREMYDEDPLQVQRDYEDLEGYEARELDELD